LQIFIAENVRSKLAECKMNVEVKGLVACCKC